MAYSVKSSFCLSCIYFVMFSIVTCDLPLETGPDQIDRYFPKEKCESILKNCSCYDYVEVAGIICQNISNFQSFSSILASGNIFENGTTYEISVAGVSSLPSRSLEGLIVFRLYLDDPNISTIEDGAFDGVLRLRRFHVRRSSIQKLPDFRIVNDSLRYLKFDNSRLTALEGEGLQNLPLLTVANFVNNSIRRVDKDVFKGTNGIVVFDLSYNELTHLPVNLMDDWENIHKVVLSHNHLLNVDGLFLHAQPRFIYLDFNNLTDLDSILHDNMTNVETLLLANNPFEKVSNSSFNFKVPKLRFLYLDHCKIREFDVNHYRNLTNLSTLDLSGNLIEKIPNQTIAFGNKVELDFMWNQIREFQAEMTFTVIRVYLTGNKLQALGRTLQYSQMIEVSIAKNEIQYLSVEDFRGVHNMANVELQDNKIRWIDRYTFKTIRNDLHYLDLSVNLIQSLNGSVRYLSQLKSLNLTNNLIKSFEDGEFTGLNELSELYLQHNKIIALNGQLQQLPQVQYLVIRHNDITTLSKEQIPQKLRFLYLQGNPVECNCKLFPFLQWLNSSDSPTTDIPLCQTHDESLHGNNSCPETCTCSCTKDASEHFMSVDCSSKNMSTLPSFLSWGFWNSGETENSSSVQHEYRIEFDMSSHSGFHVRDRVLGVNLENNNFQSVDTIRLPAGVRHLRLADNKLKRLPNSLFYSLLNLRKVTLSGNPWDCDCNTLDFKKWLLSKMDIVQDVNATRCRADNYEESKLNGKVIWTLTDLDLCPADIGLYISLAFATLTVLLLCAAGKILYTKYDMRIKVFLYAHGVSFVKEKDIDKDKRYDAFISFSAHDVDFVRREFLPVIQSKLPNIRLCIHYKDFEPGDFITNNILKAIHSSKRTVIILSNNFLQSDWCLAEFKFAHSQALKDKVPRLIVVKLGELPSDIPPFIKSYMESTTYMIWGEKYFWNSLLYYLPTPLKPSLPTKEQMKARKCSETSTIEDFIV